MVRIGVSRENIELCAKTTLTTRRHVSGAKIFTLQAPSSETSTLGTLNICECPEIAEKHALHSVLR
jgi:hypothetical protein